MISCLVIHLTRNPQGTPIGTESVVSSDVLDIGRGAACKIHLPDHQVYLHHATIKRGDDGNVYLVCNSGVEVRINGTMMHTSLLSEGTHIELGPYEIIVLPATQGCDLAISVEMLEQHQMDRARISELHKRSPLTIAALGFSKRKISIIFALIFLLLFLVIPLLPKFSSSIDNWQAKLPITMTDTWQPGELSEGHDVFGSKCSVCHRQPFKAVSSDVCLECHGNIPSHFKAEKTHAKDTKKMNCTSCHIDHNGKFGLVLHDSSRCKGCHANLKKQKPDTARSDVANFKSAHPSFRVTLPNAEDATEPLRPLLKNKAALVEQNGLKFSHLAHLNPKGISSNKGQMVMVCEDCHRRNSSSKNFTPLSMQRDCQQSGCHKVRYRDPMVGVVPHGTVGEIEHTVHQFFLSQISSSGTIPKEECGDIKGNNVQRSLACVNRLTFNLLKISLFRKTMSCGECHEITGHDSEDMKWKFAPLKINRDWFPLSKFSHSKHTVTPCEKCHDKANSKLSTDISMPDIDRCRECHVGDKSVDHKVASRCDSCHQFHDGLSYPLKAGVKPTHVDPTKK
ncbi:MAG: FHA domain-containing protein [Gallionellaceae bacterium]|nr:FHA domain-containing protein [Gallionellaceae bacterium]